MNSLAWSTRSRPEAVTGSAGVAGDAAPGRELSALLIAVVGVAWAGIIVWGVVTHRYAETVMALALLGLGSALFRGTPRLIFWLAITLNVLTVLLLAGEQMRLRGEPFSGGGDDELFYVTAREIGTQWSQGNWSFILGFSHYSGYGYLMIGAMLHLLFGGWAELGPLMPRLLDAFVGASIGPAAYLIAREIRPDAGVRVALTAGIGSAIFPLLMYQSAVGLRDIWLAAGTTWFLYCLIRARTRGGVLWAWVLPAVLLVAMSYIRGLSVVPLVAGWGVMALGGANIPHRIFLKLLLVAGGAVLVALVLERLILDLALERVKYTALALEQAGSGSIGARLLQLPSPVNEVARLLYATVAPVPPFQDWTFGGTLRGLGSAAWYLMIPFAIAGVFAVAKHSRAVAIGLSVFAVVLLLGVAFTSIDVRHKMPLYPIGIVLAQEGTIRLGHVRSWRLLISSALLFGVMGVAYFLLKGG